MEGIRSDGVGGPAVRGSAVGDSKCEHAGARGRIERNQVLINAERQLFVAAKGVVQIWVAASRLARNDGHCQVAKCSESDTGNVEVLKHQPLHGSGDDIEGGAGVPSEVSIVTPISTDCAHVGQVHGPFTSVHIHREIGRISGKVAWVQSANVSLSIVVDIGKVDGKGDDLFRDVRLLEGSVQEEGVIQEDAMVELETHSVWTKSSALRRDH